MTVRVRSRTLWLRVALGGFVVLNGLVFAARSRIEIRGLYAPTFYQNALASADRELGAAVPYLPTHGWIGYLTPGFDWSNSEHMAGVYRTQYALAPRIVVVGTQPDFVVAVSREGQRLPDVPEGFVLHRSVSSTVAVYRRIR